MSNTSQVSPVIATGRHVEPLPGVRRPRVMMVLPRGEAIRNFVYSGAVDELAQECDVLAVSVLPSEDVKLEMLQHPLSLVELHTERERKPVYYLRELLNVSHGRYLWSKAAQQRSMLRHWEANTTWKMARWRVKSSLSGLFASQAGLQVLSAAERTASRWLGSGDAYSGLLQEWKPDLVFNGSHVHSENALPLVQAAQWAGIPTAAFIFSWDNLTSQGRIVPGYDHYFVWNREARDQLCKIYPTVSQQAVTVTGTPQFDFHFKEECYWSRKEFCERVGADPKRPIVLYSTGMANHMPGEERIVELIADLLPELSEGLAPQLLVRLYPKDRTNRFDNLKSRRRDILFPHIPWEPKHLTPRVEDLAFLTNTLRHCDVGINVASTVSLELCMFDKPTLNVGFDPPGMNIEPLHYATYYQFDHYAPLVDSGAVQVCYSPESLKAELAAALRNPGRDRENRRALLDRMFGATLDGKSASRVAAALALLARRSEDVRGNLAGRS